MNISILDVIQGWARCAFLPDLHDLSDEQCVTLKGTIIRHESEDAFRELAAEAEREKAAFCFKWRK